MFSGKLSTCSQRVVRCPLKFSHVQTSLLSVIFVLSWYKLSYGIYVLFCLSFNLSVKEKWSTFICKVNRNKCQFLIPGMDTVHLDTVRVFPTFQCNCRKVSVSVICLFIQMLQEDKKAHGSVALKEGILTLGLLYWIFCGHLDTG